MEWSFHSNQPIYTQLIEQLTLAILSGEYPTGGKLPAVRELAAEMDPVHIFPINGDKENAVISRHFSTFTVNLVQAKSSKNKGF